MICRGFEADLDRAVRNEPWRKETLGSRWVVYIYTGKYNLGFLKLGLTCGSVCPSNHKCFELSGLPPPTRDLTTHLWILFGAVRKWHNGRGKLVQGHSKGVDIRGPADGLLEKDLGSHVL